MNRKNLRKCVESLVALTSTVKEEVWPASKQARFFSSGGRLYAAAASDQSYLLIDLSDWPNPVDLLVHPKNALELLKGREEEVVFGIDATGVRIGSSVLPYSLSTDFADPPTKPDWSSPLKPEVIEALRFVSKLDSNGGERATNGVIFHNNRIISSDGFRLRTYDLDNELISLSGKQIAHSSAVVAGKIFDPAGNVRYAYTEKSLVLMQDNMTLFCRMKDTGFLHLADVNRLMLSAKEKPIKCDTSQLKKELASLKKPKAVTVVLEYHHADQILKLIGLDEDAHEVATTEIPAVYGDFRLCYDIKSLAEIADEGDLYLPADNVVINNGPKHIFLAPCFEPKPPVELPEEEKNNCQHPWWERYLAQQEEKKQGQSQQTNTTAPSAE